MALFAPQPRLPCRETAGQKEPQARPLRGRRPPSSACSAGGEPSWAPGTDGGGWRRKKRHRGEIKARAFWPEVSRPSSVEMEDIATVEELEEALRRSREISQAILIEWMAAWCRKCIYLKPKLEKLAAEFHPRVKFYVVDVNIVPQALVKRGNISKMPTIQLWKDGECRAEVIGGHKAWLVIDEVREMIHKYM